MSTLYLYTPDNGPTVADAGSNAARTLPTPSRAASVHLDFVDRDERLDLDEVTCAPCAIGAAVVVMGGAFYALVWAFELIRRLAEGGAA